MLVIAALQNQRHSLPRFSAGNTQHRRLLLAFCNVLNLVGMENQHAPENMLVK